MKIPIRCLTPSRTAKIVRAMFIPRSQAARKGKTAKAIRTLLRVLGAKSDSRINLKIVEPEGSEPREPREHKAEETSHKEVSSEIETVVAEEVVEEEKVVPKATEVEEDDDLMADLDI